MVEKQNFDEEDRPDDSDGYFGLLPFMHREGLKQIFYFSAI